MSAPAPVAVDSFLGVHTGPELLALMLCLEGQRLHPAGMVPLRPASVAALGLEDAALRRLQQLYDHGHRTVAQWLQTPGPVNAVLVRVLGGALHALPTGLGRPFARTVGHAALTDTHLDAGTVARGRACDRLLAGSAWQAELLRGAGLANVVEWTPGVDLTRFRPRPHRAVSPERFVIWSCGRLDPRKGQDLVVAAFKAFLGRHPEALLLTAWQHPVPEMCTPFRSGGVEGLPALRGGSWEVVPWLAAQGIPAPCVVDAGFLPNAHMPRLLEMADVALFTGRAEAEPSGALLECYASAIPCIVAAHTGHRELAQPQWCTPLAADRPLTARPPDVAGTDGWGEASVDDIVEALEQVYQDRAAARARALAASREVTRRGWNLQVRALLALLQELRLR